MECTDTFNLRARAKWLRAGLMDIPDSRRFCTSVSSQHSPLHDHFFLSWTAELAEIECKLACRA